MVHTTFEEMGVPAGYGFKQLLFSPVANALVLEACSARDNWRPERLLFRHLTWDRYRPIGEPGELVSQESPFVHPSKPFLTYVTTRHKFSVDEDGKERHHGNWNGLHVVSLESGSEVQSVNEQTLSLPSGINYGWVCEIVAFGDSGLFVKAGISSNGNEFEYVIAELDGAQKLKPIAKLPAVFM